MKGAVNKDTLFEFFDGKTTSVQRKMIEEWLQQAGNDELFYQYLDEWESQRTQFVPNELTALERYGHIIANGDIARVATVRRGAFRGSWLRRYSMGLSGMIACLLIVAGFVYKDVFYYRKYDNPYGKTAQYVLSDGTEVILNSNSRMWVPRFGFREGVRAVRLEGEAEFSVTHTTNSSRFIVEMDQGYSIEVLGTKFVALSRNMDKRVYLTEGKVKLVLPEGRQLYMKPGYLFEAGEKKPGVLSIPEEPQKYMAWKTYQFYFDNTPLIEVVRQMEDRFGISIQIVSPELKTKELGGVYEAQNPDDLLQILSELFDIQISLNKDTIELRSETNL